jgi:hypothetical protein
MLVIRAAEWTMSTGNVGQALSNRDSFRALFQEQLEIWYSKIERDIIARDVHVGFRPGPTTALSVLTSEWPWAVRAADRLGTLRRAVAKKGTIIAPQFPGTVARGRSFERG